MNTRLVISGLVASAALWAMPGTARGQIFEANTGNGTIGEYNATTGATINASLVSGLNGPEFIDVEAASVPEASSTSTLLLLGLMAMCGVDVLRRKRV